MTLYIYRKLVQRISVFHHPITVGGLSVAMGGTSCRCADAEQRQAPESLFEMTYKLFHLIDTHHSGTCPDLQRIATSLTCSASPAALTCSASPAALTCSAESQPHHRVTYSDTHTTVVSLFALPRAED